MAYQINVLGSNLTVATKRGQILYKAPISLSAHADSALQVGFRTGEMPDYATGSCKVTIRDNSSQVYQKVFAGSIGQLSPFPGNLWAGRLFRSVASLSVYGVGLNSDSMKDGNLNTVTDTKDCALHDLQWGVGGAAYSTGSLEIEFAGGLDDGVIAYMDSRLASNSIPSVDLAQMQMAGQNSGSMKIKIDFTVTVI